MNKPIQLFDNIELNQGEKPFDLKGFLFRYVFQNWYFFVICIVLTYTSTWLYLRYTIPMYLIKSTLLIKNSRDGETGISEQAVLKDLGLLENSANLENEIQILKSRSLMTEVVNQLDLNISYFSEGRVLINELYKQSPIKVDSFHLTNGWGKTLIINLIDKDNFNIIIGEKAIPQKFGIPFQNQYGTFILKNQLINDKIPQNNFLIRFSNPESIANSYAGRISIQPIGSYSSVLQLSLKDPVPEKGVDILNKLVEVYNNAIIEDINEIGRNTLDFIDDRILFLTDELKDVEGNVENYKEQNDIISDITSDLGMLLNDVNNSNKALSELEIQKDLLLSIERFFAEKSNQNKLIPFSSGIANSGLITLVNHYNKLILDRTRLLRSANEKNLLVQNLNQEIALQVPLILESIRNVSNELLPQIALLNERSSQNLTRLQSIPRKERELLEIQRQQTIKQNLFMFLLEKREETALSLAVTVSNIRLIDTAKSSGGPVEPKPNLLYILSLFLGLTIPATIILFKELLNDTIQSEEEVKSLTNTPLLGGVAFNKTEENLVVSKNSRSAIAEMFRLLRTNLQFIAAGKEKQTILITSGSSGEGKSFITANLGISLALSQKPTILLGFDLRKPKLSQYVSLEKPVKGITNYLIDEATIEEIIYPVANTEHLFFIGSGPIPPNPAELLISEKMKLLFKQLQQRFNYILVDTPPVGLVTDALLLNPFCDNSIFVVRFGQTKKGLLKLVEDIYQQGKLNSPSIVFNGLKSKGGYNYGYGYGYGYGYYEEEKKKRWRFFRKK